MDDHDKTKSKFQKKLNKLHEVIAETTRALEKRKGYTVNADRFVRMLLIQGPTTAEELREYFKPLKPRK